MLMDAKKTDTGSFRWEFSWCPRCRSKTTFIYATDTLIRCNQCQYEKDTGKDFTTGVVRTDP